MPLIIQPYLVDHQGVPHVKGSMSHHETNMLGTDQSRFDPKAALPGEGAALGLQFRCRVEHFMACCRYSGSKPDFGLKASTLSTNPPPPQKKKNDLTPHIQNLDPRNIISPTLDPRP